MRRTTQRRRFAARGLLLGMALCALARLTAADLIEFQAGGRVQLPAEVGEETVSLDAPGGKLDFRRSSLRSILPGSEASRDWPRRRSEALAGDASTRFEAAWWALDRGLTSEAIQLIREAHALDPAHRPTARLAAILDRLAAPAVDPPFESLRSRLGVDLRIARGPHVVLLHQHGEAEARERIDLIERVIATFYLNLGARGLDLPVPRNRLVTVWLARQADYLAFLRDEGAGAFLATNGYYHPTEDAVLSYDYRSHAPQAARLAALDRRRSALSRARGALPTAGPARLAIEGAPTRPLDPARALDWLEQAEDDLRRRSLLIDLECRAIDLGTATHETVHQLVAASGLAPRHDDFPLWLHEGLAAQFEAVRGGRWAGPGRVNPARLPHWKAIKSAPRLLPLLRDERFGNGYQPDLYAQAWALVYHLRIRHPHQFMTFLDLLRAPDRDLRSGPDRTLAAFRAAITDDLAGFETAWHHHIDSLKIELEEFGAAP